MVRDVDIIDITYECENGEPDQTFFVPVLYGKRLAVAARSEDMAMLLGIGRKYLGNSGDSTAFAVMAGRMLGIKDEWTAFSEDPSLGD